MSSYLACGLITCMPRNIWIGIALVGACWCAQAQWQNPTPGAPRTPDGKPNLSAPPPRTADAKPDFTGMWRTPQSASGETDKAIHSLKAQPWAEALSKKRKENLEAIRRHWIPPRFAFREPVGFGLIPKCSRRLF